MSTELYLIRHGRQLSADGDGAPIPEDGDGLTERGFEQARRLGAHLAEHVKPDALYASPLLRAQQTAQAVSDATGLPIQTCDDLREIQLDVPPDSTPGQIMALWLKVRQYVDQRASPGSETWREVQQRATAAIDAIVATEANRKVAVVSHGGVIETLFFGFLGIPLENNLKAFVNIRHTGVFHWRPFSIGGHHGWELVTANDTRHLDEA
jgi:broad specificity phosphatase PhoE